MLRKLIISLMPVAIVASFAIIPAAAQAKAAFWEHCVEVKKGGEWETHKCNTRGNENLWKYEKIPQGKANAEQVKTHGRLKLIDASVVRGLTIEVECAANDKGIIWNAEDQEGQDQGYDLVETFTNQQCTTNVTGCTVTNTAENLPWETELDIVATLVRDIIKGIRISIRFAGRACVLNGTTLTYTGTLSPKIINNSPTVAEFDESAGVLRAGGTSEGKIKGDDEIEQENGWAVKTGMM